MHNDNNLQQDWQNYRACFCLKLTPIHTKWHTRLSTKLRKPPFRFIRNINCIYMSFFCKCIILTDTIFLLRISTTISWITFFLSFLFRQPYCWLTSLTFAILFASTVTAISHRLLYVSIFWPELSLTGSLSCDVYFNTSLQITTLAGLPIQSFNTFT